MPSAMTQNKPVDCPCNVSERINSRNNQDNEPLLFEGLACDVCQAVKTEPQGDKHIQIIAIYEDDGRDIAAALVIINEPAFQGNYQDRFALFCSDYMSSHPGLYSSFINHLYNRVDVPESFKDDPAPLNAIANCMRSKTSELVNPTM